MFSNGHTIQQIRLIDTVDWRRGSLQCRGRSTRLLLPPIQRSLVWSNEQIINFWDSLLRGYPTGMMLVHRASGKGYDARQVLQDAQADDYQLFDGQQRMAAILLGFNEGALAKDHQIWVDLSEEPNPDSRYLFGLRMQSSGQPCGYRPEKPNEKYDLNIRREWLAQQVGNCATSWSLPDWKMRSPKAGVACFTLHQLIACITEPGVASLGTLSERQCDFLQRLTSVLERPLIVQVMDECIVNDPDEYVRFFTRIGQGGSRLSEDELTYSIIKKHFPEIREASEKIVSDPMVGRLMDEVDLVLATLRCRKVLTPLIENKPIESWLLVSRPTPSLLGKLKSDEAFSCIVERFRQDFDPRTLPLLKVLQTLRIAIEYPPGVEINHTGMPAMLIARLPRPLLEVLLLLTLAAQGVIGRDLTADEAEILRRLSQYWLHFVEHGDNAALHIFKQYCDDPSLAFDASWLHQVIRDFESEGIAMKMATPHDLEKMRAQINTKSSTPEILRNWAQRFSSADVGDHLPGHAIRMLSTKNERSKSMLLWLQRGYVSSQYQWFDPTMGGDQDMPLDLDHLIPGSLFGYDWRGYGRKLALDDPNARNNFRECRGIIGNSLGNYRWLDASMNRQRQDEQIVPLENNGDCLEECSLAEWNTLIRPLNENPWSEQDVVQFQRLIDLRTLQLYQQMLDESGLSAFVTTNVTT
jgi:hypothetical protein